MPKARNSKSATTAATVQFVEPMYAQLVQQLPDGKDWFYEVKFDGYRCLAGRDTAGVTLWSRRGNPLTAQFPTLPKRVNSSRLVHCSTTRTDASRSTCCNIIALKHKRCCSMRLMC